MSNVVQFLEALARNPILSVEDFTTAVSNADLTPSARQALFNKDIQALVTELGGRSRMMCFIYPADNEEQPAEETPDTDEETPKEEPSSQAA